MSGAGREGGGPRCVTCHQPFGFPVVFCPFCGADQHAARNAATQPPGPPTAGPPPPLRTLPEESARAESARAGSAPAEGVPAGEESGGGARPARAARVRRPGWLWGVAVVLLMLVVEGGALLMRHAPTATLTVSVSPDAVGVVTIDGSQAGPPGHSLSLSVGMHTVGFAADGWLAAPRQVTLLAGQQAAMALALAPQPATLVLSPSPADATVRVDDRVVETGQGAVSVPPGRHQVTATRPGYESLSLALTLDRAERRVVPLTLAPLPTRVVSLQAPSGRWSQPVTLPRRSDFTLAFSGRVRLRIGQEVYLLGPGGPTSLGDVRGQALQVKAIDDQPVRVRLFLKPEG